MSRVAAPTNLHDALRGLGHEVVELGDAEVVVLDLAEDVPESSPVPRVARIPQPAPYTWAEQGRRAIETTADAFIITTSRLDDAIRWVLAEDRARRAVGAPRFTVIGSVSSDFGVERELTAREITLGRAASFGVHPLRPDAISTGASSIARLHARVRWLDGVIALRDLGSTNGTVIIRRGQPAINLVATRDGSPEQPADQPWITCDPTNDWVEIRIGDQVQLPGFWRFRIDGDTSFIPDETMY